MSINIRGDHPDAILKSIASALQGYASKHANAKIDIYRQNSVSVRVRIIDPDFEPLSRAERHDRLWRDLNNLSEDEQDEIHVLVLLAPEEVEESFANREFENPLPSSL